MEYRQIQSVEKFNDYSKSNYSKRENYVKTRRWKIPMYDKSFDDWCNNKYVIIQIHVIQALKETLRGISEDISKF